MMFTSENMKWVEYVAYMGLMINASNERQFSQSNPNTPSLFDIQVEGLLQSS